MREIPLTMDEVLSEAIDAYQAADMMVHLPQHIPAFIGRFGDRATEWLRQLAVAANEVMVCSHLAKSEDANRQDYENLAVATYLFGSWSAGSPEYKWLLERYRESQNGAAKGGASVRLSDREKRNRAQQWGDALEELQRKNPNITKGAAMQRLSRVLGVSVSTLERALRK